MKNLIDWLIQSPEMLFFLTFWFVLFVCALPMAFREYYEWSKLQDEIDRMMKK